ncbi:MAG: cob(I)yrinic acid a,c-diamide adenosyltransferase [Candidatus Omnitrophota bacterium]
MIQIYTGNGKGKTTAALGLALRAAGAGLNVYIAQFAKGRYYSELRILKKIKNIKVEQFGRRCFIKKRPEKIDAELASKGLESAKKAILSKKYRLVILDEINIALNLRLIPLKEVLEILKSAPKEKEIVLTGRYAPLQIIKIADLVSRIDEVRHYYKKGVKARRGIEF